GAARWRGRPDRPAPPAAAGPRAAGARGWFAARRAAARAGRAAGIGHSQASAGARRARHRCRGSGQAEPLPLAGFHRPGRSVPRALRAARMPRDSTPALTLARAPANRTTRGWRGATVAPAGPVLSPTRHRTRVGGRTDARARARGGPGAPRWPTVAQPKIVAASGSRLTNDRTWSACNCNDVGSWRRRRPRRGGGPGAVWSSAAVAALRMGGAGAVAAVGGEGVPSPHRPCWASSRAEYRISLRLAWWGLVVRPGQLFHSITRCRFAPAAGASRVTRAVGLLLSGRSLSETAGARGYFLTSDRWVSWWTASTGSEPTR